MAVAKRNLEEIGESLENMGMNDRPSLLNTEMAKSEEDKNISKGDALAHLLKNRNYGLKDCIAFGDGQNDIEMLSWVGKGYVMANADPRLKEACPELEEIGFNKDEAVAKHLAMLFGIK